MGQTLFTIPAEFYGLPVFGFGLLFALWMIGGGLALLWQYQHSGTGPETQVQGAVFVGTALAIGFLSPGLIDASGGLPIRGFGAMVLTGIIAGNWLAAKQAQWMGVDPEVIFNLALWLFVAGFVGARTFYVVEYWHEYEKHASNWVELVKSLLNIAQGGIVLYGSVAGSLIALAAFCWYYRAPVLALADLIAPAIVLGYAFGRLGCLMNGCCFGGICDLPWAVHFPEGSPAYVRQIDEQRPPWQGGLTVADVDGKVMITAVAPGSNAALAGLEAGDQITSVNGIAVEKAIIVDGVMQEVFGGQTRLVTAKHPQGVIVALPRQSLPVHPTQIYSSINAFCLCLFLWAYFPFRRRDGEVIGLLLTIYPISRYIIESIRVDETGAFGTGFSISQLVSMGLLAFMVGYWLWLSTRPRGTAFPAPETEIVQQPA